MGASPARPASAGPRAPSQGTREREARWEAEARAWRHPAQAASLWPQAGGVDPELLRLRTVGPWWDLLDQMDVCLLCSREYENLLVGLSVKDGRPWTTCWPVPHPSGIAVSPKDGTVWVALTRNPNQILAFKPMAGVLPRGDVRVPDLAPCLLPVSSRLLPGCLYIHDLALVGGRLHANAVGMNLVAELTPDGGFREVWWPRCAEREGRPVTDRNYLQLNSIAGGESLAASFFGASTDRLSSRRPGHLNFPVDGRGVVFSGATREVVARGLTRPHSVRLHQGRVFVDNSGYGEVGLVEGGGFTPVAGLPGWTRGLCFAGGLAVAGTSRIIPRFARYAPGLSPDKGRCGLHILDPDSGRVLASLYWPGGNQIFAIEALPRRLALGFPMRAQARGRGDDSLIPLFYSFDRNAM